MSNDRNALVTKWVGFGLVFFACLYNAFVRHDQDRAAIWFGVALTMMGVGATTAHIGARLQGVQSDVREIKESPAISGSHLPPAEQIRRLRKELAELERLYPAGVGDKPPAKVGETK